jgi:hypothetical protein
MVSQIQIDSFKLYYFTTLLFHFRQTHGHGKYSLFSIDLGIFSLLVFEITWQINPRLLQFFYKESLKYLETRANRSFKLSVISCPLVNKYFLKQVFRVVGGKDLRFSDTDFRIHITTDFVPTVFSIYSGLTVPFSLSYFTINVTSSG